MNRKLITAFVVSFALAVFLGMMDYETESLSHLFSIKSNVIALFFYAVIFTSAYCLIASAIKWVRAK